MSDKIKTYIDRKRELVNSRITDGIDPESGILEEAMYYALKIQGKRLRPLLFLSVLDAFNVDSEKYTDIACAIELIHTYSLIHDDLPCMDNDDFRRGKETLHKKWNEPTALLAGDTLLTYAFEKIALSSAPPDIIVDIIKVVSLRIGKEGMAGGQMLDLCFDGNKADIGKIHRMKTADLISASIVSPALILRMDKGKIEMMEEAALAIGLAFQMIDDFLDIEGDEDKVGKKLRKDEGNMSPNSVIHFGKEYVVKEVERLKSLANMNFKKIGIDFPPFKYLIDKMVNRDY